MKKSERIRQALAYASKAMGAAIVYGLCTYVQSRFSTPYVCPDYGRRTTTYWVEATYGGAISAISNSNMASYDKTAAITSVLKNQSSDYYTAVIAIASSGQASYDKVVSISNLKGEST